MMIDINDYSNNGNFTTIMYFRSPSTGGGYMVSEAGSIQSASAIWGNYPIPANFMDLPDAVAVARKQGMIGPYNHAMLQGSATGLVWTIKPTQLTATANDPYLRNGAFQIPAGVK